MTIITDIFTYFSKFATQKAVLDNFFRGNESSYNALKAQFETHNSVMEFPSYIFGHDKDQLYKRINSVTGSFLFVEYSQINNTKGIATNHGVSLTVLAGRKVDTKTIDGIDIAIIMDGCLDQLKQICAHILNDKKERLTRIIVDQSNITPYDTVDLSGSVGWSIDMRLELAELWD